MPSSGGHFTKTTGGLPNWALYGIGAVVVVYAFYVRKAASQQSAANAGAQAQMYPVNVFPPDNTQAAGITSLIALLSSGGGAPSASKSVSVGSFNSPPTFYPLSATQARQYLNTGKNVYYSPAAGTFVPVNNLTQLAGIGQSQVYGSSALTPAMV